METVIITALITFAVATVFWEIAYRNNDRKLRAAVSRLCVVASAAVEYIESGESWKGASDVILGQLEQASNADEALAIADKLTTLLDGAQPTRDAYERLRAAVAEYRATR